MFNCVAEAALARRFVGEGKPGGGVAVTVITASSLYRSPLLLLTRTTYLPEPAAEIFGIVRDWSFP